MPVIIIHKARIDFDECSGHIYSFEPIPHPDTDSGFRLLSIGTTKIQTPVGYELEAVHDANPNGDTGFARMIFDPLETGKASGSGRVYMRAARVVDRARVHDSGFSFI